MVVTVFFAFPEKMEWCSFRLVFGSSDKPPPLLGRSSVKVLKILQSTTVIRGDEIESSAVSREGENTKESVCL